MTPGIDLVLAHLSTFPHFHPNWHIDNWFSWNDCLNFGLIEMSLWLLSQLFVAFFQCPANQMQPFRLVKVPSVLSHRSGPFRGHIYATAKCHEDIPGSKLWGEFLNVLLEIVESLIWKLKMANQKLFGSSLNGFILQISQFFLKQVLYQRSYASISRLVKMI